MIQIIPALSVLNGKCIRLTQGDYQNPKEYHYAPLEIAESVAAKGFRRLHLIDLDGAQRGRLANYDVLQLVRAHTDLEIECSGGFRSDGDVRLAFESGASAVHSTSVAALDPDLFMSWLITYGRHKLTLAADSRGGYIVTSGWQRRTPIPVLEHIAHYHERGILYVKATDVGRDGTLEGPNFDLYADIRAQFPDLRLIASGGVRSLDDIAELERLGCYAVIVGKALYEGKLTLQMLADFAATRVPR